MALTLTSPHFRFQPFLTRTNYLFFSDLTEPQFHDSLTLLRRRPISVTSPPALKPVKCSRSTEEKQWNDAETEAVASDSNEAVDDESNGQAPSKTSSIESPRIATTSSGDSLSLGIREPVYEVVEVKSDGTVSTRKINRRQLLKSSGLRPRDVRSVDPSLFLTNSMPSLLVREYAILLNLGSLRAIAMQDCVLIFDYNRKGGQAFLESLLPRLNPKSNNGGPSMPFEIEVVEAALLSRIQRLERKLMDLEPRVQALLEALPNRITGDILEQLRISKQTLVELGSRAGALRQMLLDLLEDPDEIRRICIMGRNCTINKGNHNVECSVPLDKQVAEEEEEEIEMLLENYLQRCESCHGQAERLLDSAREMEDSIAVSLSSRRLEVSRVELLLQVGTFCVAVGALVAGIFGMNLKSYLEERVFAFWFTTSGIIIGGIVVFFIMYNYQGDEVEDMYILLREVKRQIPSVTAVCSGAIASDYQRLRVESVCSRLGLVSLAYLWKQDQSLLLNEMIANGIVAVTVKVAAMGLDPAKHLGKELASLNAYLHKLKESYGINVCGEGGEYETLTLDCPLFINARIVLDKYQVVMHSSDSIAPVGVLHPLAFHLENKADDHSLKTQDKIHEISMQKLGSVFEVHDGLESFEAICKPLDCTYPIDVVEHKFNISRTNNMNTFSMCCWLQDSCNDLQEDLKIILRKIESQLAAFDFGWENVLYIHLYIDDMNKFSEANETYVKFITHERCPFGVPSRSTVEMPLLEMDFSRAYVEVLVANNKGKKVLHVQSISSWAPSCIGPYSQATLHEGILHMAGQLGLDPPTMNLCSGGPVVELEQALKNSEAVAKSFNCSISTSAIGFVIYCSKNITLLERLDIEKKQETILRQMKIAELQEGKMCKTLEPIFLYVLVPDLPKRAYVEVKPILYVEDGEDVEIETITERSCSKTSCYWGFKHESWHDSCFQKCVIPGKLCAIILSITSDLAAKISPESLPTDNVNNNGQCSLPKSRMEQLSKFCIYLLDQVLIDNDFAWEDIMSLRFYIPVSLQMSVELIQPMLCNALFELSQISQREVKNCEPIFNIVPVTGAGRSASSIDDVVTCELLAQKY